MAELTIEDNIGPDEETNILYKQTDGLFLTKQTSSTKKLVDHFLKFLVEKSKPQFVKPGTEMRRLFSQIVEQEENIFR